MIVGEMRFACFSSYISSLREAHHDVVKDLSHLKTLSMFVFSAYHYLCSTKETFIQYFLEIYKEILLMWWYFRCTICLVLYAVTTRYCVTRVQGVRFYLFWCFISYMCILNFYTLSASIGMFF